MPTVFVCLVYVKMSKNNMVQLAYGTQILLCCLSGPQRCLIARLSISVFDVLCLRYVPSGGMAMCGGRAPWIINSQLSIVSSL